MFARAGVRPPGLVGSRRPEDVAAAVLHAIERDRAEVEVSSLVLRALSAAAAMNPAAAAATTRLPPLERFLRAVALGQRPAGG
jgi:hypothetical protein